MTFCNTVYFIKLIKHYYFFSSRNSWMTSGTQVVIHLTRTWQTASSLLTIITTPIVHFGPTAIAPNFVKMPRCTATIWSLIVAWQIKYYYYDVNNGTEWQAVTECDSVDMTCSHGCSYTNKEYLYLKHSMCMFNHSKSIARQWKLQLASLPVPDTPRHV